MERQRLAFDEIIDQRLSQVIINKIEFEERISIRVFK
jgi:hypothetical protein